ncbi:MAG: teichoic acid biosynthesis protein [Planctomycetota bacterium]|nr:teichoic acid biosynthesis protein [Planctomycetota bacterium]
MARIFYALSGEGRGHATRASTIVDALAIAHEVTIFAPGLAHGLLAERYRDGRAQVEPIGGLRVCSGRSGRLSLGATAAEAASYLRRLPALTRHLTARIRDERPALCITDFEPALPRAAEACGVPYISVDHQHFLVVSDFSGYPRSLRVHAAAMAFLVRRFYSRQALGIVSSFAFPPPQDRARDLPIVRAGVLLRPEILQAQPDRRPHVCAYVRRSAPPSLLPALEGLGCPVRVYGLGCWPRRGQVEFAAIDERRFVEDLATCRALVCTAGNQLVGEALWLDKPVLAIPEPGNAEQRINAHLLRDTGAGEALEACRVDAPRLRGFLDRADSLRGRIDRNSVRGNEVVLAAVRDWVGPTERIGSGSGRVAS